MRLDSNITTCGNGPVLVQILQLSFEVSRLVEIATCHIVHHQGLQLDLKIDQSLGHVQSRQRRFAFSTPWDTECVGVEICLGVVASCCSPIPEDVSLCVLRRRRASLRQDERAVPFSASVASRYPKLFWAARTSKMRWSRCAMSKAIMGLNTRHACAKQVLKRHCFGPLSGRICMAHILVAGRHPSQSIRTTRCPAKVVS